MTSYSYDSRDNLIETVDALGNTTNYTYDGLDRLVGQTFDDTTTASFTYDANRNLLTAVDANSSYTYTYDTLNRRTQFTDGTFGKSVLYGHDPVGIHAADMVAGNPGIHRVNFAAGHQFGFFHRPLNRVYSGIDIHDHPFFQAA